MINEFSRYLPLNDRLKLIDNIKKLPNLKKPPKTIKTTKLNFLTARLENIYKINIEKPPFFFQDDSFSKNEISLFENNQSKNYIIEQKGIPMLFEIIYNLFTQQSFQFIFFGIDISQFIYVLSSEESILDHSDFFKLSRKEYSIFFRIAEQGAMIRLSKKNEEKKLKDDEIIVHHPHINRDIIVTDDDRLHYVSSFYNKVNRFLAEFLTFISSQKNENIVYRSISEIITRSNNYSKIHVEKMLANNHLSSKIKQITKKHHSSHSQEKIDVVHHCCKIADCPLVFQHNNENEMVYALYFYKQIFKPDGKKIDLNHYDFAIKLCLDHGKLILSVWYLLNHIKIWTTIFVETVMSDLKKISSRKHQLFIYFQRVISLNNSLAKEKEKIDLSIQFITNWRKRNEIV